MAPHNPQGPVSTAASLAAVLWMIMSLSVKSRIALTPMTSDVRRNTLPPLLTTWATPLFATVRELSVIVSSNSARAEPPPSLFTSTLSLPSEFFTVTGAVGAVSLT